MTESSTSDREMVITRVIDAPRELVYDAFVDPAHIGSWWGPNGFTNTVHSMDVRPGGEWRYTMHGPDGTDYPNRTLYIALARPERLEYFHDAGQDNDPDRFRVTVTFEAAGGKTKVTLRAVFGSAEIAERHKAFGAVEGGNQTLQRLDNYLTA